MERVLVDHTFKVTLKGRNKYKDSFFIFLFFFELGFVWVCASFNGDISPFLFFVLTRARTVKTLKPSYFVCGVVGTFVGFPRNKRVIESYARCTQCRADLKIAGRGLSSLWELWKGVEHTRLEQKYRIITHKPLLDKSCRPDSAEEDRRIRRARLTEPPVFLQSALSLTVKERIAIGEAEAEEEARPQLLDGSVNYLWLSSFIARYKL